MQLVLDTNIWIDWLVYDDPAIAPLKAAQRDGQLRIALDEACLAELSTVLTYPAFALDAARQRSHLAEVARCTIRHDAQRPGGAIKLPRCRDPDDQKFLILAYNATADWLVTRDKALLALHRRLHKIGVRIASPLEWSAARAAPN